MISERTRLYSALVMLLAVVLASLALFVVANKNLARILFVTVLVIGYGLLILRTRRGR